MWLHHYRVSEDHYEPSKQPKKEYVETISVNNRISNNSQPRGEIPPNTTRQAVPNCHP